MNRIRELRLANGWKQSDLAKQLNVGQNTISNWETGRYEPDLDMLKRLSAIFACTTDYILGRTLEPSESDNNEIKKAAAQLGRPLDETDIRLLELLKRATPEQKQAMLELLKQFQK